MSSAAVVGQLPAAFGEGRSREEIRALHAQLRALTDEIAVVGHPYVAGVYGAGVSTPDDIGISQWIAREIQTAMGVGGTREEQRELGVRAGTAERWLGIVQRTASALGAGAVMFGCPLHDLVVVPDYRDVLFDTMTRPQFVQLRACSRLARTAVDAYLERYEFAFRPADVEAGLQVMLLRRFCSIEGARIVLPAAEYELTADLLIAAGVTIVRQEGVVLAGARARLEVRTKGVRFESLHLPDGVRLIGAEYIRGGGSVTMVKCTSTGVAMDVDTGANLVMQGCRIFGCSDQGVVCAGNMKATSCIIED